MKKRIAQGTQIFLPLLLIVGVILFATHQIDGFTLFRALLVNVVVGWWAYATIKKVKAEEKAKKEKLEKGEQ